MRLKIDWASLLLGRKFTVFLCFTLYLKAISNYKPPGGSLFCLDFVGLCWTFLVAQHSKHFRCNGSYIHFEDRFLNEFWFLFY